jgi:hypothetical protein
MDDLSLLRDYRQDWPRIAGKAIDQHIRGLTTTTDTKPRSGMGSATTMHISDSASTHGNERQYVAPLIAGRYSHGAKPNRVLPADSLGLVRQKPGHDDQQHQDHQHQRHT